MKAIWAVLVIASILIFGTFAAPAYAAQTITIDKVSSNIETGKLKIKADISGFTPTAPTDFQIVIILRNNANGERAFAVDIFDAKGKIKSNASPFGGTEIIIEKAKLDLDKGKLKIDAPFFGFTPTQPADFQVIIILRNNANGEQALTTSPFA